MAQIKKGICPSCGNNRELAYFKLGIVQSTMCVYCMERYLSRFIIPQLTKDNDVSEYTTENTIKIEG